VSELTDEYRALLSERRYAVLATQDPEGTIHQTPVWFIFEEGRFYIESNSASRKVKNLRHRPAASITVEARARDGSLGVRVRSDRHSAGE